MTCDDARRWLDAYADDELDAITSGHLDEHLGGCAACAGAFEAVRSLKAAVANPALYFPAPPELRTQVLNTLRESETSGDRADFIHDPTHSTNGRATLAITGNPARVRRRRPWGWVAAAAAIALAAGMFWSVAQHGNATVAADQRSVLAAYLRTLQPGNEALGVISTDQHTVKPWLDGRLDFAPPVTDLSAQGFPLRGARLDYLNDRPVADLVYQRGKHAIDLFVWPDSGGGTDSHVTSVRGFNLVHWSSGGMTFWAASDLNLPELERFAALYRAGNVVPTTGPSR